MAPRVVIERDRIDPVLEAGQRARGNAMKPAAVDLVLVNWNGREHLGPCLDALAAGTRQPDQTWLVDNASSDDSVPFVRDHYPWVEVIELPANVGFAEANNVGIRAGSAPLVGVLNVDTQPDRHWLEALVDTIAFGREDNRASHAVGRSSQGVVQRVGSVASRMVFADQPDLVNSTGIAVDAAGIAWDRLGGANDGDPAVAKAADIFGASAGAALYRREALMDAAEGPGPKGWEVFDPAYFMYLEDVDLAWRLRLRGWPSVYAPDARVLHAGSATSGEGSDFKNRHLARNKVWTVLKDYPSPALLTRMPLILAYDLASAPYRLVAQGQTAALRGRLDALGGLGRVLRQRRRIQARRRAEWPWIADAMEPWATPAAVLERYRHLAPRVRAG